MERLAIAETGGVSDPRPTSPAALIKEIKPIAKLIRNESVSKESRA